MSRLLVTLFSLFLVQACGAPDRRRSIEEVPQGASSQSQSADSAFHSLLGWAVPVSFYVEANAPDSVVEASDNAAETWNDAIGRDILTFAGVSSSLRGGDLYSSLEDNATFLYYESNWQRSTGKAEKTLATTVWENSSSDDQIIKGDIILNAQTYTFVDTNQSIPDGIDESRIVDAETVILHEFGHLLGLDHVSEEVDSESIMHAKTFIGPDLRFRGLSEGDRNNINTLYN